MNNHKVYTYFVNILFFYSTTAFMKNKYNIEVDNVEVCPDNDNLANPIRNLKYTRYNRTTKALSLDFTYDRPIDDNVSGGIEMSRWSDGGWKQIPFIATQPNMCQNMIRYFPQAWVTFHRNAGVQHPDQCPIPPGNYSVRNYIIQTSAISIPFWNGRFRLILKYQETQTQKTILCYIYFVKVTEIFK